MCHVGDYRFRNLSGLKELPYFSFDEEHGLQTAKSIGPIADVHTHLALTFLRKKSVPLDVRTDSIDPYLSESGPLDLDIYINKNFSKKNLAAMKVDLTFRSFQNRGQRTTHTAPNLRHQMSHCGITHAVVLPVDLPWLSWNTPTYLAESKKHKGLHSGASIHPSKKNAQQLLRSAVKQGALTMKMHPAIQRMRPDDPRAMEMYELCGELGIPVMWHGGPVGIVSKAADERCDMKYYRQAIVDFPNTVFIVGHSGALQYPMAIELCRKYNNVYLETSCQGLPAVRAILKQCAPQRIVHGSDWPFYHQSISIAKVLIATEGADVLRHQVLYGNAARLFGFDKISSLSE